MKRRYRRGRAIQSWVMWMLFTGTLLICVWLSPGEASPPVTIAQTQAESPQSLLDTAQQRYEAGRFQEALDRLQQAIQAYQSQGDALRQALALSNVSLVYQQLGSWPEATEAITTSLSLIQSLPVTSARQRVLAQALDIQGRLQFSQGQSEQALTTWQEATTAYEQAEDPTGAIQSRINQAQALQTLGLYRRSIDLLIEVNQTLQSQPASLTQAIALRNLGDAFLVTGNLVKARQVLEQSLAVAQALPTASPPRTLEPSDANNALAEATASALLSLGNLTRAEATADLTLSNLSPTEAVTQLDQPTRGPLPLAQRAIVQRQMKAAQTYISRTDSALSLYQQAAQQTAVPTTQLQAQLNQLNVLIATRQFQEAQTLYPQIRDRLNSLPASRTSIYQQIDLAQNLIALRKAAANQAPPPLEIAQLLTRSNQQAIEIADRRSQSYAIGSLGTLYEQTQQWSAAQDLTEQALSIAQSMNAIDIAYRWQWQLGRLLEAQNQRADAIAAFTEAVQSLQTLRRDLIAINRDVQFSFREQVEPVYRTLVDLLLRTDLHPEVSSAHLQQARNVIEGLQIAELDNFFREACLDTQFQLDRVVDRPDLSSAVLYTIVLPDRLELILKLPQRDLLHYVTLISQAQVEDTAEQFLAELKRSVYVSQTLKTLSQDMYNWVIRPIEQDLANSGIKTLVFVTDGVLRNIPMAALEDGQQYLIEKYNLALAPGLQIPDPKPLQPQSFKALVAGLSEARENFPPLNYVVTEVEQIQSDIPSQILLNQNFTRENFQKLLNQSPFSIVHIATHGQFSSSAAETFILAWDSPINVNELSDLLQVKESRSPQPIELLVLSACRTAAGDKRATLGLAGVAVRAGARSTIASLWNVDDEAGAALMSEFYQQLVHHPSSKAEALRQAQLKLLHVYEAPRFWASYVLLGNWL